MTLIARYYENASQAQAAQEALLGIGLGQSEMSLIEPGGDGAQANEEELAARAVKAGIFLGSKSDAPLDNLRRGYTLLAVKAPFRARLASHAFDGCPTNRLPRRTPGKPLPNRSSCSASARHRCRMCWE